MATIEQGLTGPFSGKIGPVIGYMWRQRACMRAYPLHVRYPNTEEQQRERNWFVGMVRFAAHAREALKLGLHHKSLKAGMTEGNYFILRNKQHFHRTDEGVEIDYSQLRISEGVATDVYFHEPRFEADEVVSVDFEKNMSLRLSSGDDQIYLFAYVPSLEAGILSAPVERRAKHHRIKLPEEWVGREVHLYGFVVDRSGHASNSTYIGIGRVNHYEDRSRYRPTDSQWQEFVDLAALSNDRNQPETSTDKEAKPLPKNAAESPQSLSELPPG